MILLLFYYKNNYSKFYNLSITSRRPIFLFFIHLHVSSIRKESCNYRCCSYGHGDGVCLLQVGCALISTPMGELCWNKADGEAAAPGVASLVGEWVAANEPSEGGLMKMATQTRHRNLLGIYDGIFAYCLLLLTINK